MFCIFDLIVIVFVCEDSKMAQVIYCQVESNHLAIVMSEG